MKRSPRVSVANMDVRVEGSDSRLDRDFGTRDEEFDFNLFHFWDFPLENAVDDFAGDWDDSSLERLGPMAMDALIPPAMQCPKVDTFRIDEHIDESKSEQLPDYFGITSKSCILDHNGSADTRESGAFQTQSSGSVVESSSSCYTGIFGVIPGKPRSRTVKTRPRLKPWSPVTPWHAAKHGSRTTSNYQEKEGRKKLSCGALYSLQSSDAAKQLHSCATKKCTHCEITKTPQWREGPLGPKTLCNACGVRYRSGRLFPEYRPAASPTFVPDLHSNSHRKVLEMRNIATRHARKMDESRLSAIRT